MSSKLTQRQKELIANSLDNTIAGIGSFVANSKDTEERKEAREVLKEHQEVQKIILDDK